MPVYSVIPSSLRPQGLARWCLCLWDFPGKNTGVGCHSLLQGIFPTQGSSPSLLNCRWTLYCLNHQGSPYKPSEIQRNQITCPGVHNWEGGEPKLNLHYFGPKACMLSTPLPNPYLETGAQRLESEVPGGRSWRQRRGEERENLVWMMYIE